MKLASGATKSKIIGPGTSKPKMTKNSRLLLVDSDSYTSSVLLDDLSGRGFCDVQQVSNTLELPKILEISQPDVMVFNFHFDRPDSLTVCSTLKSMVPRAAMIVIVSPGPALKVVRAWATQTQSIDVVIEKPLSDERFFMTLKEILRVKADSREMTTRIERLAMLVPEGALPVIEHGGNSEAEMFEAAVLFTDIRGSSQLIREMPPREFFEQLNQLLSTQTRHVQKYQGSVIKYTGDGVMAVFKGMGRSYLALRCGLELAALHSDSKFPFGIGIAQGLVLAGLIGDSNQAGQRSQYDVVGATVHLASRLCGLANAGEVVATTGINVAAKVTTPTPKAMSGVSVRGFDKAVDCVVFSTSAA